MKGSNMPDKLVSDTQNRIKKMLAQSGLNVKDIANETHIPYSTVRDTLNVTGRLNIPWLNWFADHFGATADHILSRDRPDQKIGENFKLAREHAGFSLKDAHKLLGTSEYALDAIENGEMEAPVHVLRKAVEEYQVPADFILGMAEQNRDTEIITALFRDIKFLLICQDIHSRQELRRLFAMLRGLSENELGRLAKVIEQLVNEWIAAPPDK
jgi:transcriptional regulator with XRE-family HTH domain